MPEFIDVEKFSKILVRFFIIILILISTIIVQRIFHRIFRRYIQSSATKLNSDPTKYNFLRHFISALIFIIGFGLAIYTVPALRTISVSLFASAGVIGVIIGFASQQAFSNIISGIFIVIFKPFRVNDRVEIGNMYMGMVEDISLRHTVIRNFENKRIIIPNSIISQETVVNSNLNDDKLCRFIEFGISYDADVDLAMAIMQEESMNHPLNIDNRTEEQLQAGDPVVQVRVIGFGESSVNLRAYVWANDPLSAFKMGTELNLIIKKRFDEEGIEIPFPYRTLVFKDRKDAGRIRKT